MNRGIESIQWTSRSLEQTLALGALIAQHVRAGDVVALNGPLGAGKTQFVRGLAAGLGADERLVSSPTFVLMCEYPAAIPPSGDAASDPAPGALVHIDAYRLEGLSDLESMGWTPELLRGCVAVIEWADRIASELPADHLRIDLQHAEGDQRSVVITASGGPGSAWAERMPAIRAGLDRLRKTYACPVCGNPVEETAKSFPFCSKRCRLVDLNKWFKGEYRIGTDLAEVEDFNDLNELDDPQR